ncbi:MAG: ABC transporter substrate-binding protein [Proteobacteria bacterium]|nr:ABC transporter substrate-binding protein [Pseudomonadota bacterium]MDA1057118.1 ABC transporter substrate-binding protein [Pseudomonadota bacterium]
MKKITGFAVAALAASLIAAPASAADEIVLGLNMAKTGFLKSSGETTETAVDIAVAEINAAGGIGGKMIKVVKFDTGSDAKQAAVATRKLAEDDHALAIIGPFSSGEARVAFAIGERLGIVQIPNAASTPGLAKGNSFAFRVTEDEGKQFNRMLTSLKRKGIPADTAAIMYESDQFVSKAVGTLIMPGSFAAVGIKVLGEPEGFPQNAFDLSPQIAKIMQTPPDVIGAGAILDNAVKILKEARRQGFKGRMVGSQLFGDPEITDVVGKEADGTIFAAGFWWDLNDKTRAFTKKFNEANLKIGIKSAFPHHVDAQAYEIVYLLAQVIDEANISGDMDGLAADRIKIRDQLRKTDYVGMLGPICFDADGDAELPGFIIELKDGQWTLFDQHPADKCEKSSS